MAARPLAAVAVVVWFGAGCGFSHIDPRVQEDTKWRQIKRAPPPAPPPVARPATRRKAPTPPPAPTGPARKPVVAVFDIENKGTEIGGEMLGRLTEYLAAQLAASGSFQVIPREQLKQRLVQQKGDSYKSCYEQSCQIEIGRELAAELSLSTVVMKLGSRCLVTGALYDLRKATADRGASAKGQCDEDGVVNALERVVAQLSGR